MARCAWNWVSTEEVEIGRSCKLGDWPAFLKLASFWFHERLYLKAITQDVMEKQHTHIQTHTFTVCSYHLNEIIMDNTKDDTLKY